MALAAMPVAAVIGHRQRPDHAAVDWSFIAAAS
jgi:hypothetical protein